MIFEDNYSAAIWPSRRWGWKAEIVCDGIMQPIGGWGATWRPTEAGARAWADRRLRRLRIAQAHTNTRLRALEAARAALSAPTGAQHATDGPTTPPGPHEAADGPVRPGSEETA